MLGEAELGVDGLVAGAGHAAPDLHLEAIDDRLIRFHRLAAEPAREQPLAHIDRDIHACRLRRGLGGRRLGGKAGQEEE